MISGGDDDVGSLAFNVDFDVKQQPFDAPNYDVGGGSGNDVDDEEEDRDKLDRHGDQGFFMLQALATSKRPKVATGVSSFVESTLTSVVDLISNLSSELANLCADIHPSIVDFRIEVIRGLVMILCCLTPLSQFIFAFYFIYTLCI